MTTTGASVERNTGLVLRLLDLLDRHQFDEAARMLSPDFQLHFSGQTLGRDETLAMCRAVYVAFADLKHDVDETLAANDRVVVRMMLRGTQTGPFEGVPASGRSIAVGQISIFRVAGDLVTEIREEADMQVLMSQISAGTALPSA